MGLYFIHVAEFNWELTGSWDRQSLCQGRFSYHSLCSLDLLTSPWPVNCLVPPFVQSLFYPSMHSLNSKEMCFTRHARGVLSCCSAYSLPIEIPLILQCPYPPPGSQWNLDDIFLFHLLHPYPLMAAHQLLPSSYRMLFVILSRVLFSCSVVLRKAWQCPWVLVPWTCFRVALSVFSSDIYPIYVSQLSYENVNSIFWPTKETYEIGIVK